MTRKPRVLFLARRLDSGGVTRGMATLGQGLMARGWQVSLASAGRTGDHHLSPEWFSQQGIEHFLVPFPLKTRRLQTAYDFARAAVSTNLIARHYRPDIIHVHWRSTSPFAQLVSSVQKVPFVASLRLEGIPASHLQRGFSFWGERTIAISTETHQYLVQTFGVPPAKIRTIYHGVDEDHFRPPTDLERNKLREELQLTSKDFVVCVIGRLAHKKGHDVLIKALAKLKSQGVHIKALFAGEGRRKNQLQQLALDTGIDNLVQFLGFREVRGVLWASDVIVLPSRIEGFATAVVEGMLCGLVPIRTPAAGAYDQIDEGVNGFIIPFEDDEALAKRLEQLFHSEALTTRMAQAALSSAREKFTTQIMVEKTIKVYEEVLSKAL